jgi:hypothetical protein
MTKYVEYKQEDGSSAWVEISTPSTPITRGGEENQSNTLKSTKSFSQALSAIREPVKALLNELNEMPVEEAEVKFGIKTVGEANIGVGVFVIGKVGGEMNYEITLKWKRKA